MIKFVILLLISSLTIFSGCSEDSSSKPEIHHVFPQELRKQFARSGIDVDRYGIVLTREMHRGKDSLHFQGATEAWNRAWKNFFNKTKKPESKEVFAYLQKLSKSMGMKGRFDYYNYRTKIKTGEVLIVTSNWMLQFATWLGEYLIYFFEDSTVGGWILNLFLIIGGWVCSALGVKVPEPTVLGIGAIVFTALLLTLIGAIYIMAGGTFVAIVLFGVLAIIAIASAPIVGSIATISLSVLFLLAAI